MSHACSFLFAGHAIAGEEKKRRRDLKNVSSNLFSCCTFLQIWSSLLCFGEGRPLRDKCNATHGILMCIYYVKTVILTASFLCTDKLTHSSECFQFILSDTYSIFFWLLPLGGTKLKHAKCLFLKKSLLWWTIFFLAYLPCLLFISQNNFLQLAARKIHNHVVCNQIYRKYI